MNKKRLKIISIFTICVLILLGTISFADVPREGIDYRPARLIETINMLKLILKVACFFIVCNLFMGVYCILSGKDKEKKKVAGIGILAITFLIILSLIIIYFLMNNDIDKYINLLFIPVVLETIMLISSIIYAFKYKMKLIKVFSIIFLIILIPSISYIVTNEIESIPIALMAMYFIYLGIFGIYKLIKGKKENNRNKFMLGLMMLIDILIIGVLTFEAMPIDFMQKIMPIGIILFIIFSIASLVFAIKSREKLGIFNSVTLVFWIPLIIIAKMILLTGSATVDYSANSMNSLGGLNTGIAPMMMADSISSSKNIGFSTGGAKDINNFRENIENGYLPLLSDITYEGLFYDYYFDTGKVQEKDEMFYPSYSYAKSNDPLSNEEEYYLSVGLNSNIKEEDFARKKLNLVIALDISGSMGSPFNSYYYDKVDEYNKKVSEYYNDVYSEYDFNKIGDVLKAYNLEVEIPEEYKKMLTDEGKEIDLEEESKTKMQIANESVNLLIDQLNENDRFGLVTFETGSKVVKELTSIKDTDVAKLKNDILKITDMGGTNFEAGYQDATKLFDKYLDVDQNEYENRIIVVTDAMPNIGTTYSSGLYEYIKQNADKKISTTFVGVGVDFNSELVENLSKVKGANYYSVHSSREFKKQMGEQFEYMVTPLVYDLSMKLESDDYSIQKVYGTNEADNATGEIMYVNTLFPSKSDDNGDIKGGIILIKLKKNSNDSNNDMKLTVSYEDRSGKKYTSEEKVIIPITNKNENYYANTGIRKAIALTRYVNLLKNWLLYEKTNNQKYIIDDTIADFNYTDKQIENIFNQLGQWERESQELTVGKEYKDKFKEFKKYLEEEIKQLNDNTMNKETRVLDILINK